MIGGERGVYGNGSNDGCSGNMFWRGGSFDTVVSDYMLACLREKGTVVIIYPYQLAIVFHCWRPVGEYHVSAIDLSAVLRSR